MLDSGASHHVTTDSQGLQHPQDYNGPEEISMGDGNKIPITYTSTIHVDASNHKFQLSSTLCAPNIKQKLIFVSQFCDDNLTSVEFFSHAFFMKDLSTGALLVRGQNMNGLYEWPSGRSITRVPCQSHYVTKSSPKFLWHQRLGHPNYRVL